MANCKDVGGLLGQLRAHAVTTPLTDAEMARLAQLGVLQVVSAADYQQLQNQVAGLAATQEAISDESGQRGEAAAELDRDWSRDHSVLFHLHGEPARQADLAEEQQARQRLAALDADLSAREQAFNDLLAKRAQLDALTAVGPGYVGLTATGASVLRDLTVALYRVSDADFETYLAQARKIDADLDGLAAGGATYFAGLAAGIPDADRAYLWAIGVGLSKAEPDPTVGVPKYLDAYRQTGSFSSNPENRLMASEILVALPRPLAEETPALAQLVRDVRGLKVPSPSALGVAAILLYGRRADGTFATANLQSFLQVTSSYETAALLGIVDGPTDALLAKFRQLRQLFYDWDYSMSEDTELSAAYLAVSEYEPDQISSKLAILARGLATYLQYPLVAASILASVATLEANETLNLVEKAYAIAGRRAAGLSQPELICVAVRMVHGIRNELVGSLDATATAAPTAARAVGYGPRPLFVPIVIVHAGYYSTFGGLGGVHPGHVHGMPAGFGGVGVG